MDMMTHLILPILMLMTSVRLSPTPPRCSCVLPSSCSTQHYGRFAQDIALLGLYAPCPTHGMVMCCDRKGLEHLYQDSIQPVIISQVTGPAQDTGPTQVTGAAQVSVTSGEVDVSKSSPCSCVPPSSCSSQLYGTPPGDTAVLGLNPPCPTHGEVLCCHKKGVENSEGQEIEQSEGQETDINKDEAESGKRADIGPSKEVRCGCIPRGICFEQFLQVTDDQDQCRGKVGLELCCVPGEHQDIVEGGVGDEVEVEDSDVGGVADVHQTVDKRHEVTVKPPVERLEVADDIRGEKGSTDNETGLTNLTSTVTIDSAPGVSPDRYSLPCLAVSLCKQEYSLTARDIARYGVMPACVPPLVRCVQKVLEEQRSGDAVGSAQKDRHLVTNNKSTVSKSISAIVMELKNLESKGNKKSPIFSLLKSRKVEGKKEDIKLPRNEKETLTISFPKSSDQGSSFNKKFFQRLTSTQRPSILRSSSQRQSILRTRTPSNAQRINMQRSSPPMTSPVPLLMTTSNKVPSKPVLPTTTHNPTLAEQHPMRPTPASPPSLTLVPCTQSCPGTAYSPLSPLHRQLYGELAACSPGLVRCVLHLDMQIFQHKDNFHLPIFNVKNFFSFFSDSYGGKSNVDQKSGVEQNDDSNTDDLSKEASVIIEHPVQALQGSPATDDQFQENSSSHPAGESSVSVMEDIEDKLAISTRRSFFERPKTLSQGSSKLENGTNFKYVGDTFQPGSNIASKSASRPQSSYPALGSIVGRLRGKQIFGIQNKQIQSIKPVRLLDKLLRDKLIGKKTASTLKTLLPSTVHEELVSRGSHLPDVGEITGVEIVMPTHQMAKVMLHMDKDMMEVKLKDEQLLPVLQALINTLEKVQGQ